MQTPMMMMMMMMMMMIIIIPKLIMGGEIGSFILAII